VSLSASSNLPIDANDAVQNFLRSLGTGNPQPAQQQQSTLFTTLSDLLSPETLIQTLPALPESRINELLSNLPPQILQLASQSSSDNELSLDDPPSTESTAISPDTVIASLSLEQKKTVLKRVFRSPQLHQSLGSLTMALRDGGLPMVSEALKIEVANGGFVRGSGMPLGDGTAVEAFLDGVKKTVEKEGKNEGGEGSMDTD
jgi:26S proteasome regulatory subunit N13